MVPAIVLRSTLSGRESYCEPALWLLFPVHGKHHATFTCASYTVTDTDAHCFPDQVPALVSASPMFACLLVLQRLAFRTYLGLPDSHADTHTKSSRKVNWLLDVDTNEASQNSLYAYMYRKSNKEGTLWTAVKPTSTSKSWGNHYGEWRYIVRGVCVNRKWKKMKMYANVQPQVNVIKINEGVLPFLSTWESKDLFELGQKYCHKWYWTQLILLYFWDSQR